MIEEKLTAASSSIDYPMEKLEKYILERLKEVRESAMHQQNLVNNILTLQKIEAKKLQLLPHSFNFFELLSEIEEERFSIFFFC